MQNPMTMAMERIVEKYIDGKMSFGMMLLVIYKMPLYVNPIDNRAAKYDSLFERSALMNDALSAELLLEPETT